MNVFMASGSGRETDRKPVSVQLPRANAGLISALKASYAAQPIDEQLNRLLARIK
ncbi:hypothetical protein FHS31_001241 [Sphingomonas vulcanisoli]|uniref:Anti-sigma factor NepR domain-containing protein n=1 Tax=Sphingomonas vulcanisoli TaxID=1658060 RepID=A0ABX0TV41_9SPHN|nr:hypothetical protein [Sphingomonas vulcanisoli]NIJ07645.1 hypothetical protein [Sphingomonas vulcanisoli]